MDLNPKSKKQLKTSPEKNCGKSATNTSLISKFKLIPIQGICMHAGIAFLVGILVTIAVFLLYAAISGTTFYGLAVQVEVTLAATLIIVALIVAFIFYVGVKAQFRRVKTGKEALIGAKGVVTSELNPKGEIRVLGEFWEATSKDTTIAAGQTVEVVGLDGMFLVVKPVEQKA